MTISGKKYCQQDQSFRTFLHDIAAAVPVCVVLPPEAWQPLRNFDAVKAVFHSWGRQRPQGDSSHATVSLLHAKISLSLAKLKHATDV